MGYHRFSVGVGIMVVALAVTTGCTAPGYSVERDMLHTPRVTLEPRIGGFVPADGDFDSATAFGFKLSYEFMADANLSIDLEWAENIDSSVASPAITTITQIRSLGPEALDSYDAFSATVGLDWDIPLSQNPKMPYLRAGIGVGVLAIEPTIDPTLKTSITALPTAGGAADVGEKVMFLVRPSFGVRWAPFSKDVIFFGEAAYDFASTHVSVDVLSAANGENRSTDEIDFGGINYRFGVGFRF